MIREPWNYDRRSHKVILRVDNNWASKRSKKSKSIESNLLNRPRVVVLSVVIIVFSFLLLKEARSVLVSNPQFIVQDIVVENDSNIVTKDVINEILNSETGKAIVSVSPNEISRILKKDPDVENVIVEKILPGTLKINIKERVPYAKLNIAKKTYLIDNNGVVLSRDRVCDSIPVISGFFSDQPVSGEVYGGKEFANVLNVLREGENTGWGKFIEITAIDVQNQENITLHTRERILIKLKIDDLQDRLTKLLAILENSQNKNKMIKIVDLRFKDAYVE
jgi:cell division septal protein FtsQ